MSSTEIERCPPGCPIPNAQCDGDCALVAVLDAMGVAVLTLDAERRAVVAVNRVARELMSAPEFPRDYQALAAALAAPAPAPLVQDPRHGFRLLPVGARTLGFAVHDQPGGCRWVFVRDVTDRTRLEQLAERCETNANLSHTLASLRHEIGNHLNSLKVALTVLTGSLGRLPPDKAHELLTQSLGEIGRMEKLFRALRSLATYDSVSLGKVDLGTFLQRFCNLVEPDLQKRGVALLRPDPFPQCAVWTDPRALQEVLLCLLSNAVDAAVEAQAPCISLSATAEEDELMLALRDNGPEVSPQTLARAREPFFSTKPNGSGLGLVLVDRLVALLGASFDLRSSDRGTEASLHLPRRPRSLPARPLDEP